MIRQKSEDYYLDAGPSGSGGGEDSGFTSPGTKRKNESTFRQLQNDVMGKARSTLSTLGDVWKTSKSTLSGGGGGGGREAPADQYHDSGGGDFDGGGGGGDMGAGVETQFSTPPRSPKSAKDKTSLDFFLWPKGKSKDGSAKGAQKKDKSSSKNQPVANVDYDPSMEASGKSRGAKEQPPISSATGTTRKPGPGPGGRGAPNHQHQHHHQQQQQQQQQQQAASPHYQHSSRAMKYRFDYAEEGSGDEGFRQRSLDETSEYSRSMEDNMTYVGRDEHPQNQGPDRYGEYYSDSKGRPKSYNEKYSSQYYDYSQSYEHQHHAPPSRSHARSQPRKTFEYDEQEEQDDDIPPVGLGPSSSIATTAVTTTATAQSRLRKTATGGTSSGSSVGVGAGAGNVGNNPPSPASPSAQKHILFNEENDILYFKENQRPSKTKSLNEHQSRQQTGGRGPPGKSASYPKDAHPHHQQQQQQQHLAAAQGPSQPATSSLRKVSREERSTQQHQQQQGQQRSTPSTPLGNTEPNIIRATLKLEKLSSTGAPLGAGGDPLSVEQAKPKGIQKQFSTVVNLPRGSTSSLPRGSSVLEYGTSKSGTIPEEPAGVAEGEKRTTGRKICFQDESVDVTERVKCQTLPRSAGRSSVRMIRPPEPNTDPSVNEYLDTDMTLPRSGSLDSDLESQAMRIVRTVGQAFEVCHKLTIQDSGDNLGDDHSELSPCDVSEQDRCSDRISEDDQDFKKDSAKAVSHESPRLARPDHLDLAILPSGPQSSTVTSTGMHRSSTSALQSQDKEPPEMVSLAKTSPLSASREMTNLRDQLDQQQQQTRQVLAQLMLVREQLISETNARMEAQARIQQLLQQNRELLEHIASLGYHEPDRPGLSATAIGIAPQLSSTAKVARWFHTLQWTNQTQSLSRPESGFVSGDSRSERNQKSDVDMVDLLAKDHTGSNGVDLCDEYLLVEGTSNLWSKLSVKKRKKLLGLKLGKVTTF